MAPNIYDDPDFLAGYEQLPRSLDGLDGAPEWPSLRRLLPEMDGRSVVDLGCGFGWFSRWASTHGAGSVVAIDGSVRMLERAALETDDATIEYRHADLETVDLSTAAFDVAYSSLVLHYIEALPRLCRSVHTALVGGGMFVFSVEHPMFTAPSQPGFIEVAGRAVWPVDRYLLEGERTTNWLAEGVVKQHRTISTYVTTLIDCGFRIAALEEWGPTDEQLDAHPEWRRERDRPPFLILACQKLS